MRNPFYNQINLKSGHLLSQELLLKEKLELGNRLMKENKIQKVNLENSDGEEEIRDGKNLFKLFFFTKFIS